MGNKTILQRLLRLDPGITLGQWAYDIVATFWPQLSWAFIAAGGLTMLTHLTSWAQSWGPLGLGAVAFVTFHLALIGVAYSQRLRSQSRLNSLRLRHEAAWLEKSDVVNPLDATFHSKRINLHDLKHPISHRIAGKTFTGCQLMGPANLFLHEGNHLLGMKFSECDFVAVRANRKIRNVIVMENSTLTAGELCGVTIFVPPAGVPEINQIPGVSFITLTGDPALDT